VNVGPQFFSSKTGTEVVGRAGKFWNAQQISAINAQHPDWNITSSTSQVTNSIYTSVKWEMTQGMYQSVPTHVQFPVDPPPIAVQRTPVSTSPVATPKKALL
jgi:hypothetical protein